MLFGDIYTACANACTIEQVREDKQKQRDSKGEQEDVGQTFRPGGGGNRRQLDVDALYFCWLNQVKNEQTTKQGIPIGANGVPWTIWGAVGWEKYSGLCEAD